MNSEESSQKQNRLLQHSQLAALTTSLLHELRKEQSTNPEYIIMNERIRGIQSELDSVLQQNDDLMSYYTKLQLDYTDLLNKIQKKITTCSISLTQKFDDHSKSSETKILEQINRINQIEISLSQGKFNEKTIDMLKESIKKKQQDIDSLSEDNEALFNKLNENNQKYQREINQKDNEIINLKGEILNHQNKIDQLQQIQSKTNKDYNEIQQRLITEMDLKDKLNTELLELKESTENHKSEFISDLEKKSEEIKNLQNQLNNYKTEIDALKKSESDAKKQLENERKFYIEQQLSGENHSKELLSSLEDSKNQIEEELNQKNKEIESLKEIQLNLNNEIDSLKIVQNQKEEIEKNLKSISDENENLKMKLDQMNQSQITQNKKILELTIANKELNDKAQNLEKDYSLRIQEIEQKHVEEKDSENLLYKEKINGMSLDSEFKQNEIDSLKIEVENLKNELNSLNDSNHDLVTELDNIKKDNEQLVADSVRLTELTNEIDQIRKKYDSTLLELEKYKSDIVILTDQKNSINTESIENKNKVNELNEAIQKLENQLQDANDTLKEKETEIQNKNVEIDLLRSSGETRKSKLNEQLIQSSKEINKLNSEISRLQKIEIELQDTRNILEQKADVEIQNKELDEQNKALLSEHKELVSIAGDFNIEIYDLRKFIDYTKNENIKLEKIVEENAKSINDLQKAIKETEETASKQMTEYENVVENINASHITEIERITNIYNQNVETLKKSNKELNEKNDNYQKEIAGLNEKLDLLSHSKNENDEEKLTLINQLNEKNKENENLQQIIQKLRDEKEANEKSSFIEQEKVNSIEVMRLNNEIQQHLNEINEIKQNHQNQIDELNDKINGLSLKNEEIEYRNNELESTLSEISNENVELKNQVNDAQTFLSIIGPLNGEIFDLRSNLQVSASRVNQMKKDNRSLKFEVQRLSNEIVILNSTLDEKRHAVTSLEQKQEEIEKASNTKVIELKSGISKMFEELEERKKHDEDFARIEQEKNQMLKDIGIFEEQIYELNKQSASSFNVISKLRSEIIGYLNDIERLKLEAQNADDNIANLVKQVSKAREEGEETEKMNSMLNSKLIQLNEVNNSLNDKINSLEISNSSLKKEKDRLSLLNRELDSRIQMSSKEKEMFLKQLDQKQEVNDAIEQLRSKLDQTIKENDDFQKEILSTKEENKKLQDLVKKSSFDQKTFEKLEFEKLELTHRVSILEGQLQIRAAKTKDSDILELEKKIEELQKIADSAISLNEKATRLEKENDKLRSERDALDLKSSELEANTASNADLQFALEKCEKLENEAKNRENYIEKIQTEKNAMELKYEELSNELETQKSINQKIEEDNINLKQNEEKLRKSLAESELKSTNTTTENLQERKESLRLKTKINELELKITSLAKDKEGLEKANKQQNEELEALSQRIFNLTTSSSNIVVKNSNPMTKSPYKMISDKSKEISELKDKIKSLEDQLSIESAEHLNTKKEMDKQSMAVYEAERRLRVVKTDFDGLVKSLTDLFLCKPNIASIIAAAAQCKKQSKYAETLSQTLSKVQDDALAARREPNYLRQKLHDANMLLDIEKKKNIVMAAKISNNITPIELPNNYKNEEPLINISQFENSLKSFLHVLADSNEISNDVHIAISNLLYKSETQQNNEFFDESSWITLAKAATSTFYKYRSHSFKMKLSINDMNKNIAAMMNTIIQHIDDMQRRISKLSVQCRDISLNQTKDVKIENKKNNNTYVSNIPRMAKSSLNDRQSRTPIQSAFQNSGSDSQTPGKSNWKSSITPMNSQKKQETPFRTPLGDLSNSTMNISFGTETPKIAMHRNTMSKIPIHFMPSGVLPPKSRNYH